MNPRPERCFGFRCHRVSRCCPGITGKISCLLPPCSFVRGLLESGRRLVSAREQRSLQTNLFFQKCEAPPPPILGDNRRLFYCAMPKVHMKCKPSLSSLLCTCTAVVFPLRSRRPAASEAGK